jgi:hypothetical protein
VSRLVQRLRDHSRQHTEGLADRDRGLSDGAAVAQVDYGAAHGARDRVGWMFGGRRGRSLIEPPVHALDHPAGDPRVLGMRGHRAIPSPRPHRDRGPGGLQVVAELLIEGDPVAFEQ